MADLYSGVSDISLVEIDQRNRRGFLREGKRKFRLKNEKCEATGEIRETSTNSI